jgi:hypothetical protein
MKIGLIDPTEGRKSSKSTVQSFLPVAHQYGLCTACCCDGLKPSTCRIRENCLRFSMRAGSELLDKTGAAAELPPPPLANSERQPLVGLRRRRHVGSGGDWRRINQLYPGQVKAGHSCVRWLRPDV